MADETATPPTDPPTEGPPDGEQTGTQILAEAARQFAEIGEYLSCYLSTQLDRAKLSVRDVVLKIFLWLLGLSLAGGALIVSLAFVFYGTALGLGKAMGDRSWLGFLVTGASVFFVSAFSFKIYQWRIKRKILRMEVLRYETKLEEQRARFGHSALEQATGTTPAVGSSPE
jgi:hypothetical protein